MCNIRGPIRSLGAAMAVAALAATSLQAQTGFADAGDSITIALMRWT